MARRRNRFNRFTFIVQSCVQSCNKHKDNRYACWSELPPYWLKRCVSQMSRPRRVGGSVPST